MKRVALLTSVALLSTVLLAIGSFGSATAAAQAAVAGGWEDEWQKVLAAAKKEGQVTLAGPPQGAERSVIMKFQKAYPDIRLGYTGAISGPFMSRVQTERNGGVYTWDVFIGGAGTAISYSHKGFFQPVRPNLILPEVIDDSKWLGGFEAGFQDKAKKYMYSFTMYVSNLLRVNRSVIPVSELNSAKGLLDPRWKGKFVVYDPRDGGGGLNALAALRAELGDDAMKVLLVDQKPVLSTDKRQLTEWIVRGQYPIGIGIADPYLAPFLEIGLGKDVARMETRISPMSPGSGVLFIMSSNPHPNATKVFVNWLLSQEVQHDWAETANTNSRRLDVPAGEPETVPDLAKMADYRTFNAEGDDDVFRAETLKIARKLLE